MISPGDRRRLGEGETKPVDLPTPVTMNLTREVCIEGIKGALAAVDRS